MNDSKKWAIYYKKEKENMAEINESLMKNIEFLEAENLKVTSAYNELQADNKEKEVSLDDAHKLIVKLNDEYSKLMKEYKLLEKYSTEITEENKDCKKYLQEKTKKFDPMFDKLQKHNDKLLGDNEKYKKEYHDIKANLATLQSENNKLEKELKEKIQQINNLKHFSSNSENLVADKDNIIRQNEQKIEELISICEKKDEEMKILIKINQDNTHENKISVDEITKQATNTIKMFYNNLNCDNENASQSVKLPNINSVNVSFRDKKNDSLIRKQDIFNDSTLLFSINELENLMKENKLGFIISENINRNNTVLGENYLFKMDLVRTELFSSIFREMNISNYIDKNIIDLKSQIKKINSKYDINLIIKVHESLRLRNEEAESGFNNLKSKYIKLQKDNKKLLEKISFLETNFDKVASNMNSLSTNFTAKVSKFDSIIKKKSVPKENFNPEGLLKLIDEMGNKFVSEKKRYKHKISELNKEIEQLNIKITNLRETDKVLEAISYTPPVKPQSNENKNAKDLVDEIEKNKLLIEEMTEQNEKYYKIIQDNKIEISKQKKLVKELQEKQEELIIQNNEYKEDMTLKDNKIKLYFDENEKSKSLNKNLTFELERLRNEQYTNLLSLSSKEVLNSDRKGNTENDKKQIEELSESNDKLSKSINEFKNDLTNERKVIKELREKLDTLSKENKYQKDCIDLKDSKLNLYLEQIEKLKSINMNKISEIYIGVRFSLIGDNKRRSTIDSAISLKEENNTLKKENLEIKVKFEKKEREFEEKLASQINNSNILNSNSNVINESFNEKNYKSKKDENLKMKEEIFRLKDEIASLIKSNNEISNTNNRSKSKSILIASKISHFTILKQEGPNNNHRIFNSDSMVSDESNNKNNESNQINNNFQQTNKKCQICIQIFEQIQDFKFGLKLSIFKDMKQFYLNYYSEIEKATVKVNEVTQKFTKAESEFNNENIDKKVKVSQVKDILSTSQKLLTLLTAFFSKYNKDIYFYTQNLKKVFDFAKKFAYNFKYGGTMALTNNLNLELNSNSNFFKNKPFVITTILKFFYEFTKTFNQTELRKLYPLYENKTISEVIGLFKTQCENLKTNILESKWDYDTEFSELDDSIIVKPSNRRVSDINMNNSYKIVNEKIIKLKKLEYDNCNFTEIIKHYAIVQEIIVKQLYDNNNEIDGSLESGRLDKFKSKHDYLEKVLNIAEDTLFFKSNELDNDSIHLRKSVIKLLKNQKAILNLSYEML